MFALERWTVIIALILSIVAKVTATPSSRAKNSRSFEFPLYRAAKPAAISSLKLETVPGGSSLHATAPNRDLRLQLQGYETVGYHINVTIGNGQAPPNDESRIYRLLVDTGSANLAVAGSALQANGLHPYLHTYNPQASTTSTAIEETFYVQYVAGMIKGDIWRDNVTFIDSNEQPLINAFADFGVITIAKDFFTDAHTNSKFNNYLFDGILGIGYQSIAVDNIKPVIEDLVNATGIEDMFGLDLCEGQAWYTHQSTMVLGRPTRIDIDNETQMLRTPIAKAGYYSVHVSGMAINGKRVELDCSEYNSPNPSIIDSGMTALVLPSRVFAAIKALLLPYIPTRLTNSVDIDAIFGASSDDRWDHSFTVDEAATFPNISISFPWAGDSTQEFWVVMTWENYFRSYRDKYILNIDTMCIAESGMTLGVPLVSATFVLFDRATNTIGFSLAPDNCGNTDRVTPVAPRFSPNDVCKPVFTCAVAVAPVPLIQIIMYAVGGTLIFGSLVHMVYHWWKRRRARSKLKLTVAVSSNNDEDDVDDVDDDDNLVLISSMPMEHYPPTTTTAPTITSTTPTSTSPHTYEDATLNDNNNNNTNNNNNNHNDYSNNANNTNNNNSNSTDYYNNNNNNTVGVADANVNNGNLYSVNVDDGYGDTTDDNHNNNNNNDDDDDINNNNNNDNNNDINNDSNNHNHNHIIAKQ